MTSGDQGSATSAFTALIDDLRDEKPTVVLFGAGHIGRLAAHALRLHGVTPAFYVDSAERKRPGPFHGLAVHPPEMLDRLPPDAVVFICSNYIDAMEQTLLRKGVSRFYDCAELFASVSFDAQELQLSASFIERRIELHRHQVTARGVGTRDDAPLILKSLDVTVSEACSMKCQDCSNLMQYYQHPRHADLEELEAAVSRFMSCVDKLYEFRILGGEPFINKRVGAVISAMTRYDNVDRVIVYSNATILPRDDALSAMRDGKVVVDISDYGEQSRKLDQFVALLTEHGIDHVVHRPVWTDSGRLVANGRSPDALDEMFLNCCVNDTLTLLHGLLYRCPFSANGTNLHAIPTPPDEIVDLTRDQPVDVLRRQIRSMYGRKKHLTACAYCNGRDYSTPVIDTALQVRRPLPFTVVSS